MSEEITLAYILLMYFKWTMSPRLSPNTQKKIEKLEKAIYTFQMKNMYYVFEI